MNFDPVTYRNLLQNEDWAGIYDIEDVDIANDFLESRVVKILDTLCPLKTIQFRKECKNWLTEETKNMIHERDNIRELARTTGDQANWDRYKTLRNSVNNKVKKDRNLHYKNLYSKHQQNDDVGALYRAAKNQVGWTKTSTPTSFLQGGQKINCPSTMANIQMDTFVEKIKKLKEELPPPYR